VKFPDQTGEQVSGTVMAIDSRARVKGHESPSSLAHRLAFGVGSIGTGIFATIPALLLLYYLTSVIGAPPFVAGLVAMSAKLWGLLSDPIIGRLSDTVLASAKRKRLTLALGAAGVALGTSLLFNASIERSSPLVLAAIFYLINATGYSLFTVPYLALPVRITSDHREQSRYVATRIAFSLLGTVLGGALAPVLVDLFGKGVRGYSGMGAALGIVGGLAMLTTAVFSPIGAARANPGKSTAGFLSHLKDRVFWLTLLSYLAVVAALGSFSAALPFLVENTFGASSSVLGGILLLMMLAGLAGIPAFSCRWLYLAQLGKFTVSVVLLSLGAIAVSLSRGLDPLFFCGMVLYGVAYCGNQLVAFTLLANHSSKREVAGGDQLAGTLAGVWTATEKVGMALGPLLAGALIGSHIPGPSGHVLSGVRLAMGFTPPVLGLIAIALLRQATARQKRENLR
jgi:GPH family glycoside/pentoside/hexuronide:cation symporter